jgi:nucleotide-binding universal stress UspA family protein
MSPSIVLFSVFALAVTVVATVAAMTLYHYRRPWRLRCPQDDVEADVQVAAGAATLHEVFGLGGVYVDRCSHREPGEMCDEACLTLPADAHRRVGPFDPALPPVGQPVVLVPLDGTAESEVSLRTARGLARARGARIRLLRVMPPAIQVLDSEDHIIAYVDQESARVTNEEENYLRGLHRAIGDVAVEDVVRFGTPAEEILSEAQRRDVAFVVMAAHRPTWVRRLLRRSVTSRVERAAWVPVIRAPYGAAA